MIDIGANRGVTVTVTVFILSIWKDRPGLKVVKLFSCSTQLSMKFSLLINMKMPTIADIFIFISREIFMLSYV